jgi:hypothetical protein
MSDSAKRFTEILKCEHCNNRAPMEIASQYSQVTSEYDSYTRTNWDQGKIYELLLCPACNSITLRSYFWHEQMEPDDVSFSVLYPASDKKPLGLPAQIEKAYEAALKVRNIDANAYAVLVGRVLEMICEDRKADGKDLYRKLQDLANKNEIPTKLVGIADSLRNMRNVGAHAVLGELTSDEVPILDDLCKAILEYVYSAPYLANQATNRLDHLKKIRDAKKGGATT